jgi:putative hemolysin
MAALTNIDIRGIIESKNPQFFHKMPRFLGNAIVFFLERVIHVREMNDFLAQHGHKKHWDFVDAMFEYIDFGYTLTDEDRKHIPAKGRLLCVANHTLGPLDGLALLRVISEVRGDVKIVASDVLQDVDNLFDLILPYDLYSTKLQKRNIVKITRSLLHEHAIIFFPAGAIAKLTRRGIVDGPWQQGPVRLSQKYNAPILPIHVRARHSALYYLVALLNENLSTFLLPHESLKQRSQRIKVTIGAPLSYERLTEWAEDIPTQTQFLRQHLYQLEKHKKKIDKYDFCL